jgi:RND family efflux transporter MFP subunit
MFKAAAAAVSFVVFSFSASLAQQGGMPPAPVNVSAVVQGMIAPQAEFIGTVYYQEVSEVASEVSGRVLYVDFEEADRVKAGQSLVRLDTETLLKAVESMRASMEQAMSELEKASIDLGRVENLYKEDSISGQLYDEHRFRVKGLRMKVQSLKSDVERLEAELARKDVKSPFGGVVIKKLANRGEWLSPGGKVAVIARDEAVDIIADVPEDTMRGLRPGMEVLIKAAGRQTKGRLVTVIPRGDVATRTFPVKIRVDNKISLMEGMEARVVLPGGERKKALIVPRDALVPVAGGNAVFAVLDGKAKMIQVQVIGYEGLSAGVYAEGLREGMKVVTKGNERLRDGQPVSVMGEGR